VWRPISGRCATSLNRPSTCARARPPRPHRVLWLLASRRVDRAAQRAEAQAVNATRRPSNHGDGAHRAARIPIRTPAVAAPERAAHISMREARYGPPAPPTSAIREVIARRTCATDVQDARRRTGEVAARGVPGAVCRNVPAASSVLCVRASITTFYTTITS